MPGPVLLSCESLTKSFTSRPLFENLAFTIAEGDHVGLVGPNGSGKSTLLKILAGVEQPDSGTRAVRKGVRIGYVPQDAVFTPGMSVEDVLLDALRHEATLDDYEKSSRIARALGKARTKHVEKLLNDFGIVKMSRRQPTVVNGVNLTESYDLFGNWSD